MEDLIKALQIFLKYGNPTFPTICEHDEMYITDEIDPQKVSHEDLIELERLGFDIDTELNQFCSRTFGSA